MSRCCSHFFPNNLLFYLVYYHAPKLMWLNKILLNTWSTGSRKKPLICNDQVSMFFINLKFREYRHFWDEFYSNDPLSFFRCHQKTFIRILKKSKKLFKISNYLIFCFFKSKKMHCVWCFAICQATFSKLLPWSFWLLPAKTTRTGSLK